MKIIGNNGAHYESDREYILTATQEEIANLMGYRYSAKEVSERLNQKGAIIPISKMYDRLSRMANMEKELIEVSAKLKAASDFVNTALPVIGHINEKEAT